MGTVDFDAHPVRVSDDAGNLVYKLLIINDMQIFLLFSFLPFGSGR